MSNNKLGPYIQRLMVTVVDGEQDEFVQQLAWTELKRLNIDIEEFLQRNQENDEEEIENTEKMLLQEQSNDK